MMFAILFEDDPAHADKRTAFMPQHLAFLARHADRVRAAGPLVAADGIGAGGLWTVEAADRAAAVALTREDPFYPTGLRRKITVLEWRQVFTGDPARGPAT